MLRPRCRTARRAVNYFTQHLYSSPLLHNEVRFVYCKYFPYGGCASKNLFSNTFDDLYARYSLANIQSKLLFSLNY